MSTLPGRYELVARMLNFLKEEKTLSKTALFRSSGRETNYAKKYFNILLEFELIHPIKWVSDNKKHHICYKISDKGLLYIYHFNKLKNIVNNEGFLMFASIKEY